MTKSAKEMMLWQRSWKWATGEATGDEQGKCCGIKNKITSQKMTPKKNVVWQEKLKENEVLKWNDMLNGIRNGRDRSDGSQILLKTCKLSSTRNLSFKSKFRNKFLRVNAIFSPSLSTRMTYNGIISYCCEVAQHYALLR